MNAETILNPTTITNATRTNRIRELLRAYGIPGALVLSALFLTLISSNGPLVCHILSGIMGILKAIQKFVLPIFSKDYDISREVSFWAEMEEDLRR